MQTMHVITWTHDNISSGQAIFKICEKPFGHVALELPADPSISVDGDKDASSVKNKKLYISLWDDREEQFKSRIHDYLILNASVTVYELSISDKDIEKIWQALTNTFFLSYHMKSESVDKQEYFGAPSYSEDGRAMRKNKHVRSLLRPVTNNIKYKASALIGDSPKKPREENCTSLVCSLLGVIGCELEKVMDTSLAKELSQEDNSCFNNRCCKWVLLIVAVLDSCGFGYSVGDTTRAGLSSNENHTALPWWLIIPPFVPFSVGVILFFARICSLEDKTTLLSKQWILNSLIIAQFIITAIVVVLEGLSKVSKAFTDASSDAALGVGIGLGVIAGILDFGLLGVQILAPLAHRPKILNQALGNASQAVFFKDGASIKKLDKKQTIDLFHSWFVALDREKIANRFGIEEIKQKTQRVASDRCSVLTNSGDEESQVSYVELLSNEKGNHNPLQVFK